MDPDDAARAWADAWMDGWLAHDADVIAARYADSCEILSHPSRRPVRGRAGPAPRHGLVTEHRDYWSMT